MSELPLYTHAPALLEFLQQRRKGGNADLSERIPPPRAQRRADDSAAASSLERLLSLQVQLYDDLYQAGIVEAPELDYIRAWRSDILHMRL